MPFLSALSRVGRKTDLGLKLRRWQLLYQNKQCLCVWGEPSGKHALPQLCMCEAVRELRMNTKCQNTVELPVTVWNFASLNRPPTFKPPLLSLSSQGPRFAAVWAPTGPCGQPASCASALRPSPHKHTGDCAAGCDADQRCCGPSPAPFWVGLW